VVYKPFWALRAFELPTCEFKHGEAQRLWRAGWGGPTLTEEGNASLSGNWSWELHYNGKDKSSSVQTPLYAPLQPLPTSQPDPILFKFTSYKQRPVDVKKNLVTHFQTSAAGVWENILGPLLYGK